MGVYTGRDFFSKFFGAVVKCVVYREYKFLVQVFLRGGTCIMWLVVVFIPVACAQILEVKISNQPNGCGW